MVLYALRHARLDDNKGGLQATVAQHVAAHPHLTFADGTQRTPATESGKPPAQNGKPFQQRQTRDANQAQLVDVNAHATCKLKRALLAGLCMLHIRKHARLPSGNAKNWK